MRLEKHPAGERAGDRVHKARSSERVPHEITHLVDRHGHDDLRDVPGLDLPVGSLVRLHLVHRGSVILKTTTPTRSRLKASRCALGTSDRFWMNLQRRYYLDVAIGRNSDEFDQIKPLLSA